jgi:Carboxypeptidase regulatory-like domain/TonB dependent receptor
MCRKLTPLLIANQRGHDVPTAILDSAGYRDFGTRVSRNAANSSVIGYLGTGGCCALSSRIALCLFLALAANLKAQVATGTIVGVVQDQTGAVVPNAQVTALHVATAESRQTRSNERGEFSLPYVRLGEYSVTAEAGGFKKKTLTGIGLKVDQTINLRIELEVGGVSEAVEVTSSAPLVESSTSSLGQVIENRKILELPLNGRNTFALGLLAGNTSPVTGMATNMPFVAGGGRFALNDVLLDGIDNNTSINQGSVGRNGINYTPSVDAVEEFKVKTNNFSAEFGRSAGSIISATIKSGTNEFHGSAFEFLRNEKLDANNFFSNAGRVDRQPFKQNQFGGTIGGPLTIPKLYRGKNRTFFFADYQGTRRHTSASSNILDIPPVDFRHGDFSKATSTIFDPKARRMGPNGTVISTPLPGNIIPQSELDPGSVATMGLLPAPNFGGTNAQSRNYLRIAPQTFTGDQFDVKIDHHVSNSNTLFGRFSFSNATTPIPGNFDGFIGAGSNNIQNSRGLVFGDVHIFSPNVVNEYRMGYTRSNGSQIPTGLDQGVQFANQNHIAMFPFPILGFPQLQFAFSGQSSGATQFSNLGGGAPNLAIENTFHWADSVSITRGNHNFKTGGELRRYRFDNIYGGGTLIFGPIFSSSSDTPGSGSPFADFMMGFPSATDGKQLLDWSRDRDLYAGGFFQDDWKVSSRLTVNVGIRYELYTQPVDARDRGGLFDASTGQFVVPGKNGFSRSIVDGDHNNWAPRLGFAYSLSRKWTIRSGAGIFYSRREQNQGSTQLAANIPNTPAVLFPSVTANGSITPPVTISTPIVAGPSDPTLKGFTPQSPLSFTGRTPEFHNSPDPYVSQWNFSVQRELTQNLLLEVAYSGLKGTKLISRRNLNQIPIGAALAGANLQANRPYPNLNGSVGVDGAIANNAYNALNVRLEKRYSFGLNFLMNYTWAKNLESNGDGNSSFDQNGGTTLPLDSYNLHKERSYAPLDVPQVFIVSYGYELPFGAGKHWLNQKGAPGFFFGGWQVNGITTLRSGFPTDIRSARVAAGNQLFATVNVPDLVPGQSLYLPNRGVDGYFNPAAFTDPIQVRSVTGAPITLFGDAARRVGRGPGSTNFDFSLFKNFRIRERTNVQFRAEAFNLTNTPTFFLPAASNPALSIGSPNFGKLSSSSATGRQVQFGLKVSF